MKKIILLFLFSVFLLALISNSVSAWYAFTHTYVGENTKTSAQAVIKYSINSDLDTDYYKLGLIAPDIGWFDSGVGEMYHNVMFSRNLFEKSRTTRDRQLVSFALGWMAHVQSDKAFTDKSKQENGVDLNSPNFLRTGLDFLTKKENGVSIAPLDKLLETKIVALLASTLGQPFDKVQARHKSEVSSYKTALSVLSSVVSASSYRLCPAVIPKSPLQLRNTLVYDFWICDGLSLKTVNMNVGAVKDRYTKYSKDAVEAEFSRYKG